MWLLGDVRDFRQMTVVSTHYTRCVHPRWVSSYSQGVTLIIHGPRPAQSSAGARPERRAFQVHRPRLTSRVKAHTLQPSLDGHCEALVSCLRAAGARGVLVIRCMVDTL